MGNGRYTRKLGRNLATASEDDVIKFRVCPIELQSVQSNDIFIVTRNYIFVMFNKPIYGSKSSVKSRLCVVVIGTLQYAILFKSV
jgi:hypothetical protein